MKQQIESKLWDARRKFVIAQYPREVAELVKGDHGINSIAAAAHHLWMRKIGPICSAAIRAATKNGYDLASLYVGPEGQIMVGNWSWPVGPMDEATFRHPSHENAVRRYLMVRELVDQGRFSDAARIVED